MQQPLVAIVGDVSAQRQQELALNDPAKARQAAEELGAELAKRNLRLIVYGGPFLEADVVRGYVAARPKADKSIVMSYSSGQKPPLFAEQGQKANQKLFDDRIDNSADWETAFYKSVASADGLLLMGGGNSAKISGLIAIGSRMPLLALNDFGGGAAKVWSALVAGSDLPTRDEINTMARPWGPGSAQACVGALLTQLERKRTVIGALKPAQMLLAAALFIAALAIVPWVWASNTFEAWMLFLAPLLAGGAGAMIRPVADFARGNAVQPVPIPATLAIGLIAGGISGVLFVTAQLTGNPDLAKIGNIAEYAKHSIPFALAVGFIAGLTSDRVFSKLVGLNVVRSTGIATK